jgi:2-keto-4-pentenoate hydratase/2-oxohepta-3-ene-1,7-dioic acid hydratase in catechol pathway
MKLVRFGPSPDARLRPGLLEGEDVYDVSARFPDLRSFLSRFPEGWGRGDVDLADLPKHPLRSVRLGPPIDEASQLYLVGANYKQHAEEAGLDVPAQPVIFQKPPGALVGPFEAIEIPSLSTQMDYEGELAVVIGRPAFRVRAADAARHVAAATIVTDTTARDLQWVNLGKHRIVDWFSSKCLARSSPIGPWLASAAEIGDPHRLRLRTELNGTVMQDADTSLMVFNVWQLIEFASARVPLQPGDVISTGTPFGVGGFRKIFLKEGDVLRVEIDGIGVLHNPVKQAREI